MADREDGAWRLVAAALLVAASAWAQATGLRFETLASEQGLAENTVKAIAEDRDGFLWFGTENGLDRFDGLEFTVIHAGDDPRRGLVEDHVNALLVARDGTLWIGTFGGGLGRHDPRTGALTTRLHDPADPASLAGNDVSALHEDRAGNVWIGMRGGGVDRLDPRTGTLEHIAFPADAGPGARQPSAIVGDGADGVYVATLGAGLFRIDGAGRVRRVALPEAFGKDLTALLYQDNGRLWIGTRGHGGLFIEPEYGLHRVGPFRVDVDTGEGDTINRIAQDRVGRVWIATNKGLDMIGATGTLATFRHDPANPASIPYDDVFAVHVDAQGTVWVGTGGGGVARHVPVGRQFTLMEHDADTDAATPGGVWSVHEADDGHLFVGTLTGGLQFAPKGATRFRTFRRADGTAPFAGDDVRGLVDDGAQGLWLGTRRGLAHLDRRSGAMRRFQHDAGDPGSLAHDFVRPLAHDAQGRLWVGTYGGGLDRFDAARDAFVHHRNAPGDPHSLSDDRVYSLLAARDGALWVGTHGGGLNRFDAASGRFARFRHDPADPRTLANDRVLALQQDAKGRLWIGSGSGLDRFEPDASGGGRFHHVEALRNHLVYGIAEDATGKLWLSTNDGLVRVDPDGGGVRRFPMRELWGASEFNGGAWHRGASGKLYFGGVSGVVVVDPLVRPVEPARVRPVLTELLLFNRAVPPKAIDPASPLPLALAAAPRIELSHEQDVFGFAFAAPRATHPERRVYAYRLDGFDDRWIETRARRRDATYTAVPPGDYVFRVRVSDAEGAWLPDEARTGVTVRPAPWRSPLALAAYAAVLAALLALWLRARHRRSVRRALAQEALRQSEERLMLALWGSGDVLLDWDLEAGTMRRLGGDERLPHVARNVHDVGALELLMHRDDFPAVRDALNAHFANASEHLEVAYRERSPGWPWKLVRARVVARDAHGRPRRFSGMQQDISQLKAVETELRELNEALDTRVQQRTEQLEARRLELEERQRALEDANRRLGEMLDELQRTQGELVEAEKMASLGRLVAGVAHEVNTPLGVGVTAVSYLRSQVAALKAALAKRFDPAEAERLCAPIEQAGLMTETNLQRAAGLVKTFKQVAVDQVNPVLRRFVVRDYLESSLQSLRPKLRQGGHEVALACDPAIEMTGRPDALYQVVANLVMNSLLHAYPDGKAGRITLDVALVDGQIRLVYADDGAGMPGEVAARVFEPFFTTRRHAGGTGLGMHIVYNLVTQALGGKIACATAPGEGVRFTITIPPNMPA